LHTVSLRETKNLAGEVRYLLKYLHLSATKNCLIKRLRFFKFPLWLNTDYAAAIQL